MINKKTKSISATYGMEKQWGEKYIENETCRIKKSIQKEQAGFHNNDKFNMDMYN